MLKVWKAPAYVQTRFIPISFFYEKWNIQVDSTQKLS